MIDRAVESALEESANRPVLPTTTVLVVEESTTSSSDSAFGQAAYEEGFLFGYRNGFFTGFGGGLPDRLDDRDPSQPRDSGYIDGYGRGHREGSDAYFTDYSFGGLLAANLADDGLFARIISSGDLALAEPTWQDGRSRGTELGDYYRTEGLTPIPLPDLITGGVQLSTAEFSTLSQYTIGYFLGYAEGMVGFVVLNGAETPITDYERGTQLGFAHGSIVAFSGGDINGGLREAGIDDTLLVDPVGFDGGFVSGYDLGVQQLRGS